jgi:hypothetical protein
MRLPVPVTLHESYFLKSLLRFCGTAYSITLGQPPPPCQFLSNILNLVVIGKEMSRQYALHYQFLLFCREENSLLIQRQGGAGKITSLSGILSCNRNTRQVTARVLPRIGLI